MAEEKGVRVCNACGVSLSDGQGRQIGRALLCDNCHTPAKPSPGYSAADALKASFSSPIMVLHILLGVVSGLWLAIVGEWGAIGLGILFVVLSPILIGVALLPMCLSTPAGMYCMARGKTLGVYCVASITTLYRLAVLMSWCCGILYLFVKDDTPVHLIPRLLWSYGIAIGPWAYWARQDAASGYVVYGYALATLFAEAAYIVIMLLLIVVPVSLLGAVKVFAGFMAASFVVEWILSCKELRRTVRVWVEALKSMEK
ncbi:MAG: hypothetical protein IMZ66_01335 [Planctomycetes bacterium]|nr:hypothetical protein [Planctomycetota bacterium]